MWPYQSYGRGSYGGTVIGHTGDEPHGVTVGKYTSIAAGAEIMVGGNHHPEWASTYPFRLAYGLDGLLEDGQPWSKGNVIIGSDVWIGRGALILSGITIGDGAVVAARSVVTKDVAPYAMVAGSPAREIKKRFPDAQIERLLSLRWWDWPEDELLSIVDLLNGAAVADLIAYGEQRRS
jgi:acetyltransferase-like isoleucine patch superfamily enzyme